MCHDVLVDNAASATSCGATEATNTPISDRQTGGGQGGVRWGWIGDKGGVGVKSYQCLQTAKGKKKKSDDERSRKYMRALMTRRALDRHKKRP